RPPSASGTRGGGAGRARRRPVTDTGARGAPRARPGRPAPRGSATTRGRARSSMTRIAARQVRRVHDPVLLDQRAALLLLIRRRLPGHVEDAPARAHVTPANEDSSTEVWQ